MNNIQIPDFLKVYSCRRCDDNLEVYRAKDNVPEYAHLCAPCFEKYTTDEIKAHYVKIIFRTEDGIWTQEQNLKNGNRK